MKKYLFLLTSSLFLLTSCNADLRELCYDHSHSSDTDYTAVLMLDLKLELDVDLPVSVEDHTKIIAPDYMKVCFYDPQTGALRSTEYVKGNGGPLHTAPGNYVMVAYTFGTEWTQIRGENTISSLEAFTSDITSSKSTALAGFFRRADGDPTELEEPIGPIIYTPDHLLVAREPVVIPVPTQEHQVVTITSKAATIMETYAFEVTNITGAEYIKSVEAFVTNQASSNRFGVNVRNDSPATIYFPVEVDVANQSLKTTFNTFGKLPGESHSFLHILITDTGGTEYHISTDITEKFTNPDHEIVIDEPVVIPPPESEGGGIAPSVDPWDEENVDVPIG